MQAENNTWEEIHQALKENRFYASQGPEIHRIQVEGAKIIVDTSSAQCIRLMSNTLSGGRRTFYGDGINHAEYTLPESERYARIEVIDEEGRKAWSNIILRE